MNKDIQSVPKAKSWMVNTEFDPVPDHIRSHWLINRLRRNGFLTQGNVVSVYIKARHKHHFALRAGVGELVRSCVCDACFPGLEV